MQRRNWLASVLTIAIFGSLIGFDPALAEAKALKKKVLIIGIDGLRTDALLAAEAPHLHKLKETGAYSLATDICGPRDTPADTVSGPGWSNILTGVQPDKHGVLNNSFKGSQYDKFPSVFVHLREVHPQAWTASYCTWEPICDLIVRDADVNKVTRRDKETYSAGDLKVTDEVVELLGNKDPELLFVYLGNVDETGHKNGFHPKVKAYMQEIALIDSYVGRVLEAVEKRATRAEEDWLVIVCTDHGGIGLGHGGGKQTPEVRQVFLIVNGAAAQPGEIPGTTHQVDVVATALKHLGVAPKPEWSLDGKPIGLKP